MSSKICSKTDFEIRIIKYAPASSLERIYRSVGWYDESFSPEAMEKICQNSTLFAGAFIKDEMVGMGRLLSDGVSDGCIQDVAVIKEFQGLGIGRAIVKKIIDESLKLGIDWIQLIATPGNEKFYESLGFEVMQNHTPMKYNISQ